MRNGNAFNNTRYVTVFQPENGEVLQKKGNKGMYTYFFKIFKFCASMFTVFSTERTCVLL